MTATREHPTYRDKHPCTVCGAGYLDCAEGWVMSLACCKSCDHPTRWTTDPPYTADEMADMVARHNANKDDVA
jgi:hypothetical protein